MSNTVGRAALTFGSGGIIVATGFPGGTGAGVEIGIVRGSLTDITQVQDSLSKDGLTNGRGFTERVWQQTLDISVSANTKTLAKDVLWPAPLAVVEVSGAADANVEVNGDWNVEPGGGWTYEANGFKQGTIVLTRRSASTADHTPGNAVALSAMT